VTKSCWRMRFEPPNGSSRIVRWRAGGFRHDVRDGGGPYLSDSVYMMRAFLKLYTVTADRKWLRRAEEAAQFVENEIQERHRLHRIWTGS
jgi:uncharacterized protein YyaL (SSP411 family)